VKYRAIDSDDRTWRRAGRPKVCLLARQPRLCQYVADRLRDDWSPEQIAGVLRTQHPLGGEAYVSHETIYRSLFIESRGVLARELRAHLCSGRPMRRSVHNTVTGQCRSQVNGAVCIADRPPEVAGRTVSGHWEGDLLLGRHWTQIATVVERATRFTVLVQLSGRDMVNVTAKLSREMGKVPEHVRRSLTWDRGMELANHQIVTANTGIDVYFADPHSPWQRGTNENTNRLLRQYFPTGVSMAHHTKADLNLVAAKLNARPRETLGFQTPVPCFEALLR
jgi:IS30 family transposase